MARPRGFAWGLLVLGLAFGVACTTRGGPAVVVAPSARGEQLPAQASNEAREPPRPAVQAEEAAGKVSEAPRDSVRQPTPEEIDRAEALVHKAQALYRNGAYDQAETVLKEALTLYPFLPRANLLMAKVFLIRGAANRDLALMHSARLMLEMAIALDPQMTEPRVLLDLFNERPLD